MTKHEETARQSHKMGNNCAVSVYSAFSDVNKNPGSIPAPRSDGGKCGAYLSAVKLLQDMGVEKTDNLEAEFLKRFGSLKCGDLRRNGPGCNNLVGAAAEIVESLL